MLRMNPEVRTTKPRRALINGALAVAGLAAVAYGLHDASVAHARFDYTNDGVFRDPQNPQIADMVLINGNTAQTVFDAARQTGIDQGLVFGGLTLAASPFIEPMAQPSRRKPSVR